MPSMSAAGLERVKVAQRKLRGERATNSLSSTTTTRAKAAIGCARRSAEATEGGVFARGVGKVGGPSDGEDSGEGDAGIVEAFGQAEARKDLGQEGPSPRAGGGDHDLRALIQAVAGVVEGVDRGPGLEVEVGRPVDPLQDVAEEGRDVVDVEVGVVLLGGDQEVLGQRHLPLAEDGVGRGQ